MNPKTERLQLSPSPVLLSSSSLSFFDELVKKHNSLKPANMKIDPQIQRKETLSYHWKKILTNGASPESRCGAHLVAFENFLILYAGEKSDPSIDLHRLNYNSLTWERVSYDPTEAPTAFRGHVAVSYKEFLIVYGGYDFYNVKLNIRSCSSSIYFYNVLLNTWKCQRINGSGPEPRRNHAACVVGESLVIWSGQNSRGDYLSDVSVLDLKSLSWIRFDVVGDVPSARIKSTLTSVFSAESKGFNNLSIFVRPEQEDHCYYGVYLFGGRDDNGRCFNDLFILRNKHFGKVVKFKSLLWNRLGGTGKVPCPRYDHSACVIGKHLIVFSGRNDDNFLPELCDLHVFNVVEGAWVEVNVFGEIPSARFAASSAVLGNRVIIFGGRKLTGFVSMETFELETNQKRVMEYKV
jgi:hypothetical protein